MQRETSAAACAVQARTLQAPSTQQLARAAAVHPSGDVRAWGKCVARSRQAARRLIMPVTPMAPGPSVKRTESRMAATATRRSCTRARRSQSHCLVRHGQHAELGAAAQSPEAALLCLLRIKRPALSRRASGSSRRAPWVTRDRAAHLAADQDAGRGVLPGGPAQGQLAPEGCCFQRKGAGGPCAGGAAPLGSPVPGGKARQLVRHVCCQLGHVPGLCSTSWSESDSHISDRCSSAALLARLAQAFARPRAVQCRAGCRTRSGSDGRVSEHVAEQLACCQLAGSQGFAAQHVGRAAQGQGSGYRAPCSASCSGLATKNGKGQGSASIASCTSAAGAAPLACTGPCEEQHVRLPGGGLGRSSTAPHCPARSRCQPAQQLCQCQCGA